jgi:glycosyltransferase involved in cell wall biosynthesis
MDAQMNEVELSIVMPCLNEAETLAACIKKAQLGIERAGVIGEIIIADNGSTDGSQEIAKQLGARVLPVAEKGYGSALRGGIRAALGKWIIMGDADDSYDFSQIDGFVGKLREGNDLVMGCRLPKGGGTILQGAMPWKNRWIGNPSLSFIGQMFFKSPARDFHCGLRAFRKDAFEKMQLKTTGMEFASEMVISSTLKSMRVSEVPIVLHPDGRSRAPHLKPWRDGWRHLRFMLIYSPRWLFLIPGLLLSIISFCAVALLSFRSFNVAGVVFDAGTLGVACMSLIVGIQLVAFAFFTKVFAIAEGLLPADPRFSRVFNIFTLEKGLLLGIMTFLIGFILLVRSFLIWHGQNFGPLSYSANMHRLIPATTLVVLSIQIIFSSFFMSVLGLKTMTRNQ